MEDVRGDPPPPPPPLPPQLAAAARKKLLLVLACTLALPETSPLHATASAHASYTTDHSVATTAGPAPERLAVSGRDGARTVDALRGLDHPAVYVVDAAAADDDEEDHSNASVSDGVALGHAPLLFALPPPAFGARTCLTSLEIDHACLCLSPPLHVAPPTPGTGTGTGTGAPAAASAFVVGLGSGNVKSLEGQVELLLTPTRRLDRNATLLAEFDKQVDNAVRYVLVMPPLVFVVYAMLRVLTRGRRPWPRYYVDKLMEEVAEAQAETLRRADSDILRREASLKEIKDEIERERRAQESLLRELKGAADGGKATGGAGGGGCGGGSGSGGAAVKGAGRRSL